MSLKSFYPEQLDQLSAFAVSAAEVVRCVQIDPEMKPMLVKALAKMEENPEFPHAFMMCVASFKDASSYFDGLFELVVRAHDESAGALAANRAEFTAPVDPTTLLEAPAKFVTYASALAESLPDRCGSLVFVIDPDEVIDGNEYRKSIRYLAEHTRSNWLKFLVFDSRTTPMLAGIEQESSRIGLQTFYLSPAEIEKRVKEDLASKATLTPAKRRQHKGLLAGFAFARKEYDRAAALQEEWAAEAESDGALNEAANAYYNLGNTLLGKGDFVAATDVFCRACDRCVEHKAHSLAPYAYANLGISLHRQGRFEEAFAALRVARDMFKAQNQRAGEAYVVDCLANMYMIDGRKAEAEKTWRYELSIYDGMTSSIFQDLRDGGRRDVLAKLKQLDETI